MEFRGIAVAAAVFGVVAAQGADLGKYMLPDADIMAVSVGDDSQKGPYSKAIEAASADFKLDEILKEACSKDQECATKIMQYIDLLTNGVKRVETAMSAKLTPGAQKGPGDAFETKVDIAFAAAGLKNLDKIFAKLAADFPKYVKLENGALVPVLPEGVDIGGTAKAWVEDGVLRATFDQTAGPRRAPSPKAFKALLARLNGAPYAGLRIKDPIGIVKRFVPPEGIEQLSADENMAEVMKLRGAGFDCIEDKAEPFLTTTVTFVFDAPATAESAAEKLIGFKQLGLMTVKQMEADLGAEHKETAALAKKTLSGVKVEAKGDKVLVTIKADARDAVKQLKSMQNAK